MRCYNLVPASEMPLAVFSIYCIRNLVLSSPAFPELWNTWPPPGAPGQGYPELPELPELPRHPTMLACSLLDLALSLMMRFKWIHTYLIARF
jgi:hypothetical protein